MSEAKDALRGGVFFIAWFLGGLFLLYGLSPLISTQPFVFKFFQNSPWTYFEFVSFWFWFVITPILFWWNIIRPVGQARGRTFHR